MPASPSSNSAAGAARNRPLYPVFVMLMALAFNIASVDVFASPSSAALSSTTALSSAALSSAALSSAALSSAIKSPLWNYRVTGRIEQNRDLFTQGFVFDRDTLWISSGLYAQSHIVALDSNNRVTHQIALPENIFGEGMAIANDQLWVLSWREQRVLRYNLVTQKSRKPLLYTGEGWGLTFDGKQLIRSDGTSTLHFHRSTDFKLMRTLKITDADAPINNINELEWVDGFIYANVWLTDTILIIDPANGRVTARLNLAGLLSAQDARADTDVLNGIAWNPVKKELWVTGKRWPARFRIEILKP